MAGEAAERHPGQLRAFWSGPDLYSQPHVVAEAPPELGAVPAPDSIGICCIVVVYKYFV